MAPGIAYIGHYHVRQWGHIQQFDQKLTSSTLTDEALITTKNYSYYEVNGYSSNTTYSDSHNYKGWDTRIMGLERLQL